MYAKNNKNKLMVLYKVSKELKNVNITLVRQ